QTGRPGGTRSPSAWRSCPLLLLGGKHPAGYSSEPDDYDSRDRRHRRRPDRGISAAPARWGVRARRDHHRRGVAVHCSCWEASIPLATTASLTITTRATDGTGDVQTEEFQLPQPDGASGRDAITIGVA